MRWVTCFCLSLLLIAPLLLTAGNQGGADTTTINGQNNGFEEHNFDRATILALDCRRFDTPQLSIKTSPGWHFLLIKVSRMRGTFREPQEAEVPLFANFEPDREYNIDGGVFGEGIGISLYTDDHLDFITNVNVVASPPTPTPDGASSAKNKTEYTLECSASSVSFSLPSRWKPLPENRANALVFALDKATNAPSIGVTATPRSADLIDSRDEFAEQEHLAEDYLADLRRTNWKNAGMIRNEKFTVANGRTILQWLQVSNVRHLVSFVPQGKCVLEVNMWGKAIDNPEAQRDFAIILESARAK
jgi:hypothetical protein